MSNETVIIKYNAGNIQSVLFAMERIGQQAVVSDEEQRIRQAARVIFPGVGEASTAMSYLRDRGLDKLLLDLKQPVLGICLGMQLMCRFSEENNTNGLGIFNEEVRRFQPGNSGLKVPQIGWNKVVELRSPLFEGISQGTYFYFVHSYFAAKGSDTIGVADYVEPYSAALHHHNFYGVQFHPEKSATAGEQLLNNFIRLS